MTKAIGRALATAVLGALLGAAFMAFWYVLHPRLEIDFDINPPRLLEGTFPVERDSDTGRTFAWTGRELRLQIAGLDRSVDWNLDVRVRGARAEAGQNPVLSFLADDVLVDTRQSLGAFDNIRVTIPANPERRRGVLLVIRSSTTFVPGAGDSRALGIMVDRLSLTPAGVALPPRRAFAGAALSAAALGAAVALLGVTAGSAVGSAVLLSAAAASMLSRGFGPYTDYPVVAIRAAAWIGVFLAVVAAAIEWRQHQPLRNTARFVAAFSGCALFLELLVLLHPDMPADRTTAPFAWLIARVPADITLLRVVALSANTVAGALLYVGIVKHWGDRIAAAMAVALYHLLPIDFRMVTPGSLTNVFAQSLSVVVLLVMAAGWLRWKRPVLTSAARAVFAAAAIALLLSAAWYDGRLVDPYRLGVAGISPEATAGPDAAADGIGVRLVNVPGQLQRDLGIPALALAAAGAWHLRRRRPYDRLTLTLCGWGVACALLLALDVITRMHVRYDLAAMPAVAIAGASGASALWMERRAFRVAAGLLLVSVVWIGIRTWWTVLP